MTGDDVRRVLNVLAAAYPGVRLDDPAIESWTAEFAPLDGDAFMVAAIEWVEREDRFPTIAQMLYEVHALSRRLAAKRAIGGLPCPCGGDGWVTIDAQASETYGSPVRPCQRCRPLMHARWAAGHFARDHICEECIDLRRGRRAAS